MVKKDTAQAYRNEAEAGLAIRESGLARHDIFITTKYSGLNGLDIETSIQNSLNNVCLFFFLQRMIWLIHFEISDWLHSWGSHTSICTSSIILDWLLLISQLRGRRWKISKMLVLPSMYHILSSSAFSSH